MHFGVAHGTLFQNPKTHIFEGKRISGFSYGPNENYIIP
jgi:hypothetical protein